jgi:hypothetical protein
VCHVVLLSGARCDRGSRREGGDAPYVYKDQLNEILFNENLSPHEAGVAEGVHKVVGMCALGVAEGVRLAT